MTTKAKVEVGHGELYTQEGQWRFRIVARNGQILSWGESYERRADAEATLVALIGPKGEVRVVDG